MMAAASHGNRAQGRFVGLCTIDLEYVVTSFPLPNRKIAASCQELTAGGPATNAAVTFSFLGGTAAISTAVGCHPLASIIQDDLLRCGVEVHDVAPEHAEAPALSSIFVHAETGERTVVSANAGAYPDLQYEFGPNDVSGVDVLLVDGHHMPLCIAAAKIARELGIAVVLDGGSWKADMPDLLPLIDIAICSEDFISPGNGEGGAIQFVRDTGIPMAAITRGAKPTIWISPTGAGEVPVRSIKPKDTLGAGDIFHGAFCWAYASGYPFRDALALASDVATESCLHYGTRSWMSSFDANRHGRVA